MGGPLRAGLPSVRGNAIGPPSDGTRRSLQIQGRREIVRRVRQRHCGSLCSRGLEMDELNKVAQKHAAAQKRSVAVYLCGVKTRFGANGFLYEYWLEWVDLDVAGCRDYKPVA